MSKLIEDRYLGDGVYASFDGSQIWLDLRGQDTTTRIALDQRTFQALLGYAAKISELTGHQEYEDANPIDPDPKQSFEEWLKELDKIFIREIGLSYDDVEDYMWIDEWEGGHTPKDSFHEWNLIAGPDSL